jgi:signal transduction histidine kinase
MTNAQLPRGVRLLALDLAAVVVAFLDVILQARPSPTIAFGLSMIAVAAVALCPFMPRTALLLTMPGLFDGFAFIAPMIALFAVAVLVYQRWQIWICSALTVAGNFLPWPPRALDDIPETTMALSLIYAFLVGVAPVALGLLVQARRELSTRLAELTTSRDREQQLVTESALSKERAQLAREMHDVVSHQVSLIAVQAGALQVTATDPPVREAARTIRQLSVRTLEELRHMVDVLRAAGSRTGELAPQPRLADIPRLIETSGVPAITVIDPQLDGQRWPDTVERAAYRTVQEALTNVRKHAAGAKVEVRLSAYDGALEVEVVNGPPPSVVAAERLPGGGHGLLGLRERAELLGGSLLAGPTGERGFAVKGIFRPSV